MAMVTTRPVRGENFGGMPAGLKADQLQAQMTREQFADWQNRVLPLLDQQHAELRNTGIYSERANRAIGDAQRGVAAQQNAVARTLMPFNRAMTADQRAAMRNSFQTTGALNAATNANMSRTRTRDEILEGRMDLLGIEQGLADQASDAASQASGLQAQREGTNRQIAAQNKQQKYQTIGTAMGLGLMGLMFLSSRDYKTDIKDLRDTPLDKEMDKVKIKSFRYKPDMGLGNDLWVGPIAEDLPGLFQGPDGKSQNAYNTMNAMFDRMQRMDKRLRNLEDSRG